jgi:hypothetical protein
MLKCVCSAYHKKGGLNSMKGIQFVVDDSGKKSAVLIDLLELGELWEDIYDVLVSESRKYEPTVDWEELKAEIK